MVLEITPSKALITATWNDIPHLTDEAKAELLSSIPPNMRKARSEGIPSLGVGAIYPLELEEISVLPRQIPKWWPRGYALDVGWNRTAALWGAIDRDTDTLYFYSEYYAGQQLPLVHASAIKARGAWMRGCIDPASRGSNQKDGTRLMTDYVAAGLKLTEADNAVEAGIQLLWERFATGRAKVFTSLSNFAAEYRLYRRVERRNEFGHTTSKILKENDHLMDCARYLTLNHAKIFATETPARQAATGDVTADRVAGY